ncbi:MAG: hypothetical protein HY368_01080 [Candidatus Aenigmarchaeota archaeon]|nr:hypothetical protein [Candidatus Aenigmarchaeota archaeon]
MEKSAVAVVSNSGEFVRKIRERLPEKPLYELWFFDSPGSVEDREYLIFAINMIPPHTNYFHVYGLVRRVQERAMVYLVKGSIGTDYIDSKVKGREMEPVTGILKEDELIRLITTS